MSDDFLFADDVEEETLPERASWKVLIVDDEPEIHAVTKLALNDFIFQDRDIEFISAHSGEDAKRVLREHNDIAVILLDVVMETDDAGLRVARFIRDEIKNYFTRIILRTGQPGQAPELDVILNYDINDYKSKTELTSQKLFTSVISALRSYRDIINLENSRRGLENILTASSNLFNIRSLEGFMDGLVQQLTSLIGGAAQEVSYISAPSVGNGVDELADYLLYKGQCGDGKVSVHSVLNSVNAEQLQACRSALANKSVVIQDDFLVAYCHSNHQQGSLLLLTGLPRPLDDYDRNLIELFASNVQLAFEQVQLTSEVETNQKEILEQVSKALVCRLSGGRHIQRVTLLCELLAQKAGLSQDDIDVLSLAVRLHDIGSLVVPVNLLSKSGELAPEEMDLVRQHVSEDIAVIKDAEHPVIKTAAMLAREQHECWDGSGYPKRLKQEQIHIFSRILAIADEYDSLRNEKCKPKYRPLPEVVEYFQSSKGALFDPLLVDILLSDINQFEDIIFKNPDSI